MISFNELNSSLAPPNPTSSTSPTPNPKPPQSSPPCLSHHHCSLTLLSAFQKTGPRTHGSPRRLSSSLNTRTRMSSGRFSTPSRLSLPSCLPARPASWRSGWLRPHSVRPFCFKVGIAARASRNSMPITLGIVFGFCCKWVSYSPTGPKYPSSRFSLWVFAFDDLGFSLLLLRIWEVGVFVL